MAASRMPETGRLAWCVGLSGQTTEPEYDGLSEYLADANAGASAAVLDAESSSDTVDNLVDGMVTQAGPIADSGAPFEEQLDKISELTEGILKRMNMQAVLVTPDIESMDISDDLCSPLELMLKAAAEGDEPGGQFNLRGAVGRAWYQDLKSNPELKESYTSVGKSFEAQRAFRADWERKKWQVSKQAKIERLLERSTDSEVGEYTTVHMIANEQGRDPAGVRATANIIAECVGRFAKGCVCYCVCLTIASLCPLQRRMSVADGLATLQWSGQCYVFECRFNYQKQREAPCCVAGPTCGGTSLASATTSST